MLHTCGFLDAGILGEGEVLSLSHLVDLNNKNNFRQFYMDCFTSPCEQLSEVG